MRNSQRRRNCTVQQTTPSVLYKYMHPDRLDVVENQKIRFTQPNFLNDPFEVRPIFRSIFDKKDLDKNFRRDLEHAICEEVDKNPATKNDKSIKEIAKVLVADKLSLIQGDFMAFLEGISPSLDEQFYKASKEKIAILSLTEDRNNLLMWSHYADQHRGFVIGFDAKHSFINHRKSDADELRHPRQVKYTSTRPTIDSKTISANPQLIFGKLFLTKSTDWGYEKEWRVLEAVEDAADPLEIGGETICLYDAPHDAITEIVIGARASDKLKNTLALLVKLTPSLQHVRLYRAVTSFDHFGLDFLEVRVSSSIEDIAHDLHAPHKNSAVSEAIRQYATSFEAKTGFRLTGP